MIDNALTQNEIDSLLAQAMGQDGPETAQAEKFLSVRPYDFRRPSKFSKDQLRTLQLIFGNFARLSSTLLTRALHTQAHLALVSIQQAVFDEYTRGLPPLTLLNLVTADPLPGTFVFETDLNTAYMMLDLLAGGVGLAEQPDREMSDLEEVLMRSVTGMLLNAFADCWAYIAKLDVKLQRIEYSLRFVQIAPATEPVLLLLFDLRILNRQTTISMCIPFNVLEPLAPELNMQLLFAAPQRDGLRSQEGSETHLGLQKVQVPVVAMLGSTVLPLAKVNDLQLGDVIRLDGPASDPILVSVDQKPKFVARPGQGQHAIGVQILGVLPDEVDL